MLMSQIAFGNGYIRFQALYAAILNYNMHKLGIKLQSWDSIQSLKVCLWSDCCIRVFEAQSFMCKCLPV